jgi:hypothetical protein
MGPQGGPLELQAAGAVLVWVSGRAGTLSWRSTFVLWHSGQGTFSAVLCTSVSKGCSHSWQTKS